MVCLQYNKVFVPDLLGIERSESLQNDDVIALAKTFTIY